MAKVIICDICKRPIWDRQYKIKIKREMFSVSILGGSWFEKLDICEDCADKIIYECRKESDKNDNR